MKPRLLKAVATGDLFRLEQALGLRLSPPPAEPGDRSCLEGVTADGSSALHIAAGRGYLELVKTVCAHAPSSLIKRRNHSGDTPLICAARAGHADVADYLAERSLEERDEDGNPTSRATNSFGETAMHEAVRNGYEVVLEKLMSRDSGLAEVVDGNGVSPLYLAVASNRADMVKVLIRDTPNGGRSPASYSGPDGQTALHAAVYVDREIGVSLQSWEETLAKKVDKYGRTALHYATLLGQKLEPVESSLAYIQDNEGLFPIHIAAIMGNVNAVCKFMQICLNYDELLDNKRRNILHCAVEHGRVMLVWHICRNPKFSRMMNARDGKGNTPLHLSIKHGRAMIFFFLMVDPRVNLDIMNNEGSKPLDVALNKAQSDDALSSFTSTAIITCLNLCEAYGSPWHLAKNLKDNSCSEEKKESSSYANVSQSMLIRYSIFIVASSSLAAVSTPPGGYIAEGTDAGNKPVLGGRTGFWIFMIANSISFFLSIPTIFLFVFARLTRDRRFYLILSAALFFGAVLSTLITLVAFVGLTLDPENSWDEYIFLWLVSDLAVPIGLRIAMQLWTSKHRWQDISKVIVQAILLIHVVRASMGTVQSMVKSVQAGQQEPPCSRPGCVIQDFLGYIMADRHKPHTVEHELRQAVATGDTDLLAQVLVLELADQGDEPCLKGVTTKGSSALHIAASRGFLVLVNMICTQDISLIMATNNFGDTPLICAARAGHVDVDHIEHASAKQEAVDPVLRAQNSDGETAMHVAIRNGHVLVLQKLMLRDSRLAEVVDGNGVSPLYLSILSNRADMVDILIRESPDGLRSPASYLGPDGQTVMHVAVFVSKGTRNFTSVLNSAVSLGFKTRGLFFLVRKKKLEIFHVQ
ncbi:hypothetical protein BAE44_0009154 [Dichanthelium oligosanthes]|uniref:PGG domain-containing protein n=1 Tax=Dichanthelium oligosanthes TaxID=888268 RepID=A0A1E5VXJ4_9POAL|nr:hypothetical protein BAE44_0009154 [Dichanthelium oligosanthes]